MYNFGDVCTMGGENETARVQELAGLLSPDDPINIQFTSGTTGSPKGATLSHCNVLNNGQVNGDVMKLTEKDRVCIPVPLYHCFGMVIGSLGCMTHGSAAIFPGESFEPLTTLQTLSDEKCTTLHGVPTMFIAQLDHPQFDTFSFDHLRTGIMEKYYQ